jgi:ribosomal protein S18 acetylase RimI-like enzyme
VQIRSAREEDLQTVLSLLNEVTLDLYQKGIYQWDYPWEEKRVLSQINNQHLYVLLTEGHQIAGTFCVSEIHKINDLPVEANSKYLSQIAVSPKLQGMKFGSKIIQFACSLAEETDKTLYLDCWAGNDKLKAFYTSNGLTYTGDFPEEDYRISIFKYN